MAKVTYMGSTYECVTAIRGTNYIHLLDDTGTMIAAFDSVSDFTYFSISEGEWQEPKPAGDCNIAIFTDDGRLVPGPHKCKDISGWQALELVPLNIGVDAEPTSVASGTELTFTLPKAITVSDKSIYEVVVDIYGLFSLDINNATGAVGTITSLKSATAESGSVVKYIDMRLVPTTLADDGSDSGRPVLSLTFPRVCTMTGIYKAGNGAIVTTSGYRYGEKEVCSSVLYEAPPSYEPVDKIRLSFSKDVETYGIIFKYREISI